MSKHRLMMQINRAMEKNLCELMHTKLEWKSIQADIIRKAARIEGVSIREKRRELALEFQEYRKQFTPEVRNRQFHQEYEKVLEILSKHTSGDTAQA